MRAVRCSYQDTARARLKRQHDTGITVKNVWIEECSSLVVKYANAIGLSECYKAGDFPNILETGTWKLMVSVTSEHSVVPEISIVSSYIYAIGTWLCFGEQSPALTAGLEPNGCLMLLWPV